MQLDSIAEVEQRLLAAAPGAAEIVDAAARASCPARTRSLLDLPVSVYARRTEGGGRRPPYNLAMAVVAGERRIVTVLFADIVGSTAIGERLGPERSKFLHRRGHAGHERRGASASTAPSRSSSATSSTRSSARRVSHEDDSERAVRAALAIQRALARYADEVEEAYGVDLAVRMAINTGPVVDPAATSDGRRYNALGDTVNVASRLQKLAAGGEHRRRPDDQAPGRGAASSSRSSASRSSRAWASPSRPSASSASANERRRAERTPLVGRDFELAVLERAMDGLVEGRGAIVSITGEPGIGKSAARRRGARRATGTAIRFVEGRGGLLRADASPTGPIRDLLRDWLGVGASTPEARVRLELKAQLARALRRGRRGRPIRSSPACSG